VAEVAILGIPPVIGVLAILIAGADVMRNGTPPEEFPHLRKDRLRKINIHGRRIGMLDPLIFVPHGIRAILRKDGDNLLPGLITLPLMECPVLPESTENLPSCNGMELRLALHAQLLAQGHLRGTYGEGAAGDGAGFLHWLRV